MGSGRILELAIKKYGKENFIRETLETCESRDDLNNREKFWIAFYNATNRSIGYNIARGGEGGDIFNCLSEERKKMTREKLSISSTINPNNFWKGKHQPTEMIEKRRLSMIGKTSPMKNKHQSNKAKDLISRNNSRYWSGKHIPEDTKNKIRSKRIKQNMSYRHSSYVLNSSIKGKIKFSSVKELLKISKISKSSFYRLVNEEIDHKNEWTFIERSN